MKNSLNKNKKLVYNHYQERDDIMKKVLKSIFIILIILIIGILYISYITTQNDNQYELIAKNVKDNYKINEEIKYSNQYGNYYIIKTKTHVIVLNLENKEILKEKVSILKENKDNLPLIYKTNKLMYEKTIRKENKITYKYYDATTGDQIKTIDLKRQ